MIRDFVAIDFETANQHPCSVCSVGIVIVKNGEMVDSYYSLIRPEPDYYSYFCQKVHGLSKRDTMNAPLFPDVWKEIEERIADVFPGQTTIPLNSSSSDTTLPSDQAQRRSLFPTFVAHNARFDEGCLKAVFRVYQMDYPDYYFN